MKIILHALWIFYYTDRTTIILLKNKNQLYDFVLRYL